MNTQDSLQVQPRNSRNNFQRISTMTQPIHAYSKEDQYESKRNQKFDKTNPLANKKFMELKVSPNSSTFTQSEIENPSCSKSRKTVTLVLPEIAMSP